MERDPVFISALERLLQEECKLHEEYVGVMNQEREAVTKFNTPVVAQLAQRRGELAEKIAYAQDRRLDFLKRFPEAEEKKLSELILQYCHPDDARRLSPLVRKLKDKISFSRKVAEEFQQVIGFSLTMVNGTLSLLWSATQNVTKGYSRSGALKENYQTLKGGILEKA